VPLLPDLALARSAVDRLAERRDDEAWLARAWADTTTRVLPVSDGRVGVDEARGRLAPVVTQDAPSGERYLLGRDTTGTVWFAVHTDAALDALDPPLVGATLRDVGAVLDDREAGLAVHAIALANWHRTHPRCARCGAETEVWSAGAQRRCRSDGWTHFPRTDPAVIVLVTDPDDRALLGRQDSWPAGRFSTLAGFVEPGESAERAVVREVAEESGVVVDDVEYLGSQPWPFPASLMLGYSARSHRRQAPRPDGVELAEARWFSRDELTEAVRTGDLVVPPGISIARRLVEHWYGVPLPLGPAGAAWRSAQ
jgi:NAD+ diphosphatase